MAVLSEAYLKAFLASKKTITDLMKLTNSSFEDIETFVRDRLCGELQNAWIEKLNLYEQDRRKDDEISNSFEDDFVKKRQELYKLKEREKEIDFEIEKLNSLLNEKKDIEESKKQLELELYELEKKFCANIVFDKKYISQYNLITYVYFEDIDEYYSTKNTNQFNQRVGELLSLQYSKFPKTISFECAINIAKAVIYINDLYDMERKIKIFATSEISEFIYGITNLEKSDFES